MNSSTAAALAVGLYAIIWIIAARLLYASHREYPNRLHERGRRFRVGAKYLVLALVWPLFLLYLAVTAGIDKRGSY